jgi:PAS domain S-box-containing protein
LKCDTLSTDLLFIEMPTHAELLNPFLKSNHFFYIRLNQQGLCTFANEYFLQQCSYTADALAGQVFSQTIFEEDRETFEKCFQRCLTSLSMPVNVVLRTVSMLGHTFWTSWQLSVLSNAAGKIAEIQALGYKINGDTTQPQEIIDKRRILKAIFDSTNNVTFFVAPDYTILFFNKKAYDNALVLHQRELRVGDNMLDYVNSTQNAAEAEFRTEFTRALQGEQVITESEVQYRPGLAFWFQTEYHPVYEYGDLIGVAITVSDISERKKYEGSIQRQHEQLQTIAHLQSHKTRQPVCTILGLVSILDKTQLSQENQKIIELLEATTRKLDEVIHQIVHHTRSSDKEG